MNKAFAVYLKAFQGLPPGVWAFSFVLLVQRSGTMVLPFLTLHLRDHLGMSEAGAAQLLSVYGLGSFGGVVLGGWLTSRVGAVLTMKLGLIGVAPIFLLLLHSSTVLEAALSMLALSLVGDAVRPAAMTATAQLCEKKQLGRAFALNRLMINIGMSIGPAIAGLLYAHYFHVIFYVDAITCLLAAAMMWLVVGRQPIRATEEPGERTGAGGQSAFWRDHAMVGVLLLFAGVMVVFLQTLACYPIYLRDEYQISEATIGLMFTINTGLIIAFEMVLIASLENVAKLPVIAAGSVLIVLGFGILPFGGSLAFLALTVVIWTLGEMLSMPLLTSWVSERASDAQRPYYLSAVTGMFSLAWVIAPILGGAAYGLHPDAIWYVSLGSVPLIGLAFWAINRKENAAAKKTSLHSDIAISHPATES